MLDGPHAAILVQGDDQLGALARIHVKLYAARVNDYASTGVADGRGASGYVLKDVDPVSLARSIQDAHAGQFQLDDALTRRVIMRLGSTLKRSRRSLAEPLTERETQILRMVVEGTSNKAIASRLGLGEGTIKSHLRNIYRKLQVRTRAEAAAHAVQLDL